MKKMKFGYLEGKYEPFKGQGHQCDITNELKDPTLDVCRQLKYSRWKTFFTKLIVVSNNNEDARLKFYSQLSLDHEKLRQIIFFPNVIHPLSDFRIWWENIMIVMFTITLIFTPYDTAFLEVDITSWEFLDGLRIFLSLMSLLDVLVNAKTGYQDRLDKEATLDPRTVITQYLKTTFVFDFMSSIPVKTVNLIFTGKDNVYLDIFDVFRLWRVYTLINYVEKFSRRYQIKLETSRIVKIIICGIVTLIWITCLQFTVTYWHVGRRNNDGNLQSWLTTYDLWESSTLDKFYVGFYRTARLVTFQGYGEDLPLSKIDDVFVTLVWIIALIFHCVLAALLSSLEQGNNSSRSTYYKIFKELNAFMDKNELTKHLRQKILQYFERRYNKTYFNESEILNCTTNRLRQDVMMHSCRQVVQDVPFLRHLPVNLLMSIVSNVRLEIFLPNDVIIKADTIGDCMYFIITGTVAIYTANGKEICRLSDGAHLGEMALLGGRGKKRGATVIAVEPCEMCRLDQEHFAKVADVYPDLMVALARAAAARLY